MKETIMKIEKAIKELNDAIKHLKEGDIQSLLRYFESGYTNVSGHLPSFVAGNDYTVYEMFAISLDKAIEKTDFHTNREKVKSTGEIVLHYKDWEIAKINVHKREIVYTIHFEEKEKEMNFKKLEIKKNKNDLQERSVEVKKFIEKNEKKQTTILHKMKERQINIPKEIENLENELISLEQDGILLKEIKENIPKLNETLKSYDFITKNA